MAAVAFTCTNPNCQRHISFDQEAVGTVQQCPYCAQRVIVPEFVASDAQAAIVPVMPPPMASASQAPYMQQTHHLSHLAPPVASPYVQQQERHLESQTARKLNMGAGCFAMVAVLFAFFVLGIGTSFIFGDSRLVQGALFIFAAFAGMAAFAFFGYIATETSSTTKGSDRR